MWNGDVLIGFTSREESLIITWNGLYHVLYTLPGTLTVHHLEKEVQPVYSLVHIISGIQDIPGRYCFQIGH